MKDNLTFWTDVYCKENIVRNFTLNCYCTAQLNIQTSRGGATTVLGEVVCFILASFAVFY